MPDFKWECTLHLNLSKENHVLTLNICEKKITFPNLWSMNLFEWPKSKLSSLPNFQNFLRPCNRPLPTQPFMKANDSSPLCALPHPGKSLSLVTKAKSAKTVGLSSLTSGKVWPRIISRISKFCPKTMRPFYLLHQQKHITLILKFYF